MSKSVSAGIPKNIDRLLIIHDPFPFGLEGRRLSLLQIRRAWRSKVLLQNTVFKWRKKRFILKCGALWRIRLRPSVLKYNELDYDLLQISVRL